MYDLAIDNEYDLAFRTISFTTMYQLMLGLFQIDVFGVPNFLLFLVIATVLIDARYGVLKSVKQSKEFYIKSLSFQETDPEKKMYLKKSDLQKFDPKKLQFTFFKCLTLMGYLYFAKNILEVQDSETTLAEIIGFASGVVTKAPLAIFWYYDFKSIGDNAAYLHGKKAPIFKIVEKIFEPRINSFFNNDKKEE